MRIDNQKKRAHVVVRANVVELQVDGEGVVRTLIFDGSSVASRELARIRLLKEAIAMGYVVDQ